MYNSCFIIFNTISAVLSFSDDVTDFSILYRNSLCRPFSTYFQFSLKAVHFPLFCFVINSCKPERKVPSPLLINSNWTPWNVSRHLLSVSGHRALLSDNTGRCSASRPRLTALLAQRRAVPAEPEAHKNFRKNCHLARRHILKWNMFFSAYWLA